MTIEQFMQGIRHTESGSAAGNYTAKNRTSGAYGAYQFLERFWADFLRYAKKMGRTPKSSAWPPDREAQDTVFRGIAEYYLEKYENNWDLVAVAWHAGHTIADKAVKANGGDAAGVTIQQIDSVHSGEASYLNKVREYSGDTGDPAAVSTGGGGVAFEVLQNGSEGAAVRELQQKLNDNGANLVVDGKFGSATEAALRKFQTDGGYQVNGVASSGIWNVLGMDRGSGGAGGTSGDGTQLNNMWDGAKLWHNTDTDTWYVVAVAPDVEVDGVSTGELYAVWEIESDDQMEALLGAGIDPTADWSGTTAAFTERGAIHLGGADELRNFEYVDTDPFAKWEEDLATLAATRPWLLEPEFLQLSLQATMEREDQAVSLAEIQGTEWWRTHTAAERIWIEAEASDPAGAQRAIDDMRTNVRAQLQKAGVTNASDAIVNFMADNTTKGHWSTAELMSQIVALSDPYAVDKLNSDMTGKLADEKFTPETTRQDEDTVRDLVQEWLGPQVGQWSEKQVADAAGKLRNDPESGRTLLLERLKDQRMAAYGNYSDRELSYESIAAPVRTQARTLWGTPVDDTDGVFQKALRMNDPDEAEKLLRKTGFDRGYDRSVKALSDAMTSGMQTNVRGVV